jgi:hypothetical protein
MKEYSNPVNYLALALEAAVLVIVVFSATYLVRVGSIGPAVAGFIGTPIAFIIIFYIEVIHRPIKVLVTEDHLLLHFRYSKPLIISYKELKKITMNTEKIQDGAIKIDGSFHYKMRPELCRAIISAYQRSQGRPPTPFT